MSWTPSAISIPASVSDWASSISRTTPSSRPHSSPSGSNSPRRRSARTACATFIPTAVSGCCSAAWPTQKCAFSWKGEIYMKAVISLIATACLSAEAPPSHLTNIRQLTSGGQNAEAYWSPDGQRLIFQTTRPPYGCDQIFIMNADGSDQHLVSTGKGRTTCGYFLKDGKHIMYASTHETAEACPTPPDRSKGYLWGVFPGYDIYVATDAGKILEKLTDAPGYDAEATVNWKTGRVVFTSKASGDLDLWTMRTDGSHKKRITTAPGYDGGPVFSRDGKKLVWRANYPATPETMKRYKDLLAENLTAPMKMEIVVSDANGKNARTVTQFGCASFAPTFTPDGKK